MIFEIHKTPRLYISSTPKEVGTYNARIFDFIGKRRDVWIAEVNYRNGHVYLKGLSERSAYGRILADVQTFIR
jgi:hypothetical protein